MIVKTPSGTDDLVVEPLTVIKGGAAYFAIVFVADFERYAVLHHERQHGLDIRHGRARGKPTVGAMAIPSLVRRVSDQRHARWRLVTLAGRARPPKAPPRWQIR